MPHLYQYDLGGGFLTRGFTNTYSTGVQQQPEYDPSLDPNEPLPPKPEHIFPDQPSIDDDYKNLPLFFGTFPTSGNNQTEFAYMVQTPRSSGITYPGGGIPGNAPTAIAVDVVGEKWIGDTMQCKLWHPGVGLLPTNNFDDPVEYPAHDCWNEFQSIPAQTVSIVEAVEFLMGFYPLTEYITLRPIVSKEIGYAVYRCEDPNDGWFSHVDNFPDSPQSAVANWDWYAYTDYQPLAVSGSYPRGETQQGDLVDIARNALATPTSSNYPPQDDKWFVEPISTLIFAGGRDAIIGGWAGGYQIDAVSLTSNHHLLRPTALEWPNQNPLNKANRQFWLPDEVESVSWSALGLWGSVELPEGIQVLISGYALAQGSRRWMAVL